MSGAFVFIRALVEKIRSNKALDYFCSTRTFPFLRAHTTRIDYVILRKRKRKSRYLIIYLQPTG